MSKRDWEVDKEWEKLDRVESYEMGSSRRSAGKDRGSHFQAVT